MTVRVKQFTVSKKGDLLEKPYFRMVGAFGGRYRSEERAADVENEKRRVR